MAMRRFGTLEFAMSIPLPTAEAQSIVGTVEEIPLIEVANKVFGKQKK
jgi:hypothetical protein